MQSQVPPQIMAQMLASQGGAPGGGSTPPDDGMQGGPPPDGGEMDPHQAAQIATKLGITPQNLPMVKQAVDTLAALLANGPPGGSPPGAGGPPPGAPPQM